MATCASTTASSRTIRPRWSRCSTGSWRRSATPPPISPSPRCRTTRRRHGQRRSPALVPIRRRRASRRSRRWWTRTSARPASPPSLRTSTTTVPFAASAWPPSCRVCTSGRSTGRRAPLTARSGARWRAPWRGWASTLPSGTSTRPTASRAPPAPAPRLPPRRLPRPPPQGRPPLRVPPGRRWGRRSTRRLRRGWSSLCTPRSTRTSRSLRGRTTRLQTRRSGCTLRCWWS
mmetsp:Transcript_42543/g.141530  ORF Transcript_42543/g.141530 Transcript_42543/m.141530 type:complete len:231 (+) Transcript_42543:743-1435(+)